MSAALKQHPKDSFFYRPDKTYPFVFLADVIMNPRRITHFAFRKGFYSLIPQFRR